MARNLNLNAALRLDAKGFKKELSSAVRSLEGFRRDFLSVAGALGASLGIGGIVSSLKETATQLNVARATLENTSSSLAEYRNNLDFVRELSVKYKQDLIVLTDSFAKFHAASMGTNFTLAEQKELYQGLTQAATFFHMSSERTENMMIAVEQMMSKGKVTAEELRRQLGNNLPGAYARVAQAAINFGQTTEGAAYKGIKSFADFEKAMSDGKIGTDVLLQFIRDLNNETKGFNTQSLQMQMNDLKNAWIGFVESADVESALKEVYRRVANLLNWITNNTRLITDTIVSIVVGAISLKIVPAIHYIYTAFKELTWGSWLAIIVTGLTSVYKFLVRIGDRINTVNKAMKELNGISDKEERLAAMKKQKAEWEAYVNDPKKVARYKGMTRDEFQRTLPAPGYAQYKGIAQLPNADKKYYNILEALPRIEKEIKVLEEQIALEKQENEPKVETGDTPINVVTPVESKQKSKTVSDYLTEYNEGVKKLKNQLNAGSKTNEEYKDDLYKLAESTWEDITAFENFREQLSKLPSDLQEVGNRIEAVFDSSKYDDAAAKAEKDAKERADAWQGYNNITSNRKPRDSRFDYRLTEVEKLRVQQEEWNGIAEDLKEKSDYLQENFDKLGVEAAIKLNEVNAELKKAQENATNLKDAADLAEWREEIKNLKIDLGKEILGGIAGAGRGIKSLVDGVERIKNVFEDTDATGWDKIESILNEIAATFQLINTLVETFNTLTEISKALSAAKGATELANLSQQVAAQGSLNAKKVTDIALTEAATAAQGANASATIASTSAKSGEAVANAAASGAKLPFPLNLAAITASVGGVIAALSMINGFANGGFVGGNSRHGDKNLIAANTGELVLTTTDQARLYKAIKTGNFGGGSQEISFRLRGTDIIGSIHNTNQRRRG